MIGAVAVYDIFVEHLLVYVGVTSRPNIRVAAHKGKGNIPETAELRVVAWYNSRAEALAAEKARIKELKPPLNSVFAVRAPDRSKVKQRREEITRQAFEAHVDRKLADAKKFYDDIETDMIAFCAKLKAEGLTVEEIHKRCGHVLLREDVECWIEGRKAVR
jgi:predicted GIY-YIG superfamily endonuclease